MISVGLPWGGNVVRQLRSWSQPQPPCNKLQKEVEIWEDPFLLSGKNTTVKLLPWAAICCRQKHPCSSKIWFLFNHPFISENHFLPASPVCVSLARGSGSNHRLNASGLGWSGGRGCVFLIEDGSHEVTFRGWYLHLWDLSDVKKQKRPSNSPGANSLV